MWRKNLAYVLSIEVYEVPEFVGKLWPHYMLNGQLKGT